MDIIQTIVLALVQGLSEFLPVSSSAHLILLPKIINWQDQGILFDITVHLGTFTAVVFYYKNDIKQLTYDFYSSIINKKTIGESKLVWGILIATIPVGLVGFLLKDFIELNLRSLNIIAFTTLIFGVLLGFAYWFSIHNDKPRNTINWFDVVFIAAMQTLALVPGVSRSGITITAGLLVGLSIKFATKFAFLLAIPIVFLLSLVLLLDVYNYPQQVDWITLLIGFVVSALSAYLTIYFFIKLLHTVGLIPFVIYRVLLGLFLLML